MSFARYLYGAFCAARMGGAAIRCAFGLALHVVAAKPIECPTVVGVRWRQDRWRPCNLGAIIKGPRVDARPILPRYLARWAAPASTT